MKLIDAKKDHYRRLAHEQGYRSRASYKLKEINKSYRIIGPGSYVLDLGCAPGGWSQVAHQVAGNQGKVLGIDLSFVEELPGVELIRGDIEDPDILEQILSFFNRKVDSVICDLSPNVSGNWSVDHAVQISLTLLDSSFSGGSGAEKDISDVNADDVDEMIAQLLTSEGFAFTFCR